MIFIHLKFLLINMNLSSSLPVETSTKHSNHLNRYEIEIYDFDQQQSQFTPFSSVQIVLSVTLSSKLGLIIRKKGHVVVEKDNQVSLDYVTSLLKLVCIMQLLF